MVQRLPTTGYVFDAAAPRAPAVEQWEQMLPDERARVVAMLPAEVPLERITALVRGKYGQKEWISGR